MLRRCRSCDPGAEAAYIHLTNERFLPGRNGVLVDPPEGLQAFAVPGREDGKLAGLEVLGAASLLHAGMLAQAVRPGHA